MNNGFWITGVRLQGPGVDPASIQFNTGLNVVCGPSDTGKTFIAECIDFAFGASNPPKDIPEAEGYDTIELGIFDRGRQVEVTLRRALRGGDIGLVRGPFTDAAELEPETSLSQRHTADDETCLSGFLLATSGLLGKEVIRNRRGDKNSLSFRYIAHLIVIDEERIFADRSPVLSGQYTTRTAEQAVFRLLLTGTDDSAIIRRENPRIVRSELEAKAEILQELIVAARAKIGDADQPMPRSVLSERLRRIDDELRTAEGDLSSHQEEVQDLEVRRERLWRDLRRSESRIAVLRELHSRFQLLDRQYESDIYRLEALEEVARRFMDLPQSRCPVCGAVSEHHLFDHDTAVANVGEVAAGSREEAKRIRGLQRDLAETRRENSRELEELQAAVREHSQTLDEVRAQLEDVVKPRLESVVSRIRVAQAARHKLLHAREHWDRIEELQAVLSGLQRQLAATETPESISATVTVSDARGFTEEVERLLDSWQFPNAGRVTFSEDDQDLVIAGRSRASHGKGVRALTHAAFSLGLMRYSADRGRGHPGLLVLDSPLVVYREPDLGEGESLDVKDWFYRNLLDEFSDLQVIVLENEEPPPDVEARASMQRFTGTELGRRGFIP